MPDYGPEKSAEQIKLNKQLEVTRGLLDEIAGNYKKITVNHKPMLDLGNQMVEMAQDTLEKSAKEVKGNKAKAKALDPALKRMTAIEEGWKHIGENIEGLMSGDAELFNFDLNFDAASMATQEMRDAADYAKNIQEALGDPKTAKVFDSVDKGAAKMESMLNSLPGGNFIGEQLNLTGPEGSISKMSGELKGDFLKSIGKGGKGMGGILKSTKFLKIGLAAVAIAALQFGLEANKIQKDLGVSYTESAKILGTAKAITAANKLNGMTQEETLGIMKGIASEFGSYSDATAAATLQASNLVANYGMGADSVGILARQMQAVGESSLDSALNSIELQANMARAADVPVGEVMNDVAKNTELFAKFGKDGGGNITAAAIAAKKLGLELSNVASIADSLLNFEDSIQSQMEAEVLLGKELNLEKAREMVFNNDIAGAMEEISKLVTAQEFEAMDAVTRASVAKAAGLDAAAFGKAVSGNKGGGITSSMRTGGAPGGGGATSEVENQTKALVEGNQQIVRAIQNLEVSG